MPPISRNSKKLKTQIHCPVSGCLFAEGSERHFTDKKFLNQHIAKVHAEKKYACTKCQKSFGLDWWRKHHEKTCGMIWKCDCGVQYTSRESLLTHLRRTQHKLPQSLVSNDKLKQSKPTIKPPESPVIVLIQPIIQNINCIQPYQISGTTQRRILPKTSQPVLLTLPYPIDLRAPASSPNSTPSVILEKTSNNLSYNPSQTTDRSVFPASPNKSFANSDCLENGSVENGECQKTVATQTVEGENVSAKRRQSQASQCSRRKPKSLKVGIESHTQTAESAVVKIKKKRSRRKSVAITKDTSVLTDQMLGTDNSFWPGFKDFVLQNTDLGTRLFKNSTSTQTHIVNSKTLCDSETITDSDLLNFSWEDAMKVDTKNAKDDTDFHLMNEMNNLEPNTLSVDIDNNNMQELSIFSSSSLNDFTEMKTPCKNQSECDSVPATMSNQFTSTNNCQRNELQNMSGEKCSVFSVFGNCEKPETGNKVPPAPTLSDIHTQTIPSAVLDYNLLTNMETQTTDDFNFSYLEFSDTETQTLWEDFPSMEDSPLEADQLSIEIQTDFSSFGSGLGLDPYELINSVDVQTMMAGCSSKESAGVNTETQTLDKFYFPQFTNSESQTLDMSDFMFDT